MTTSRMTSDQMTMNQTTGSWSTGSLLIDCHRCDLFETPTCADCVVTFLCRDDAAAPVVVDLAEVRAMRMFDSAGLVPPLRHRAAATGP